MPNFDDKRVTRIQAAHIALLHRPQARGSTISDFKTNAQHPCPKPVPTKRDVPSPASERPGKAIRLISPNSQRQDTMKWEGSIDASLPIQDESPWDTFRKYYECDLAGPVAVSVRISGDRAVRAVRQYPKEDSEQVLQALRSLRHRNLASIVEIYRFSNSIYTLSNFDPLVLDHIVACKAFPNEQELAAIMSQLIAGLSYLVACSFHHPSLICSNVLMNLHGEVKIGAVIFVHCYTEDDGVVGIDNLDRWRSSPAAIEFLSTSVDGNTQLPGDLIGLAWFALISARTFYSYTPRPDAAD
ncbi:hypothetical protein N7450_011625 [Penicillium hetheringtonii]|uniref:Protein kinase domain-containing protein n=1 Tax=Penicillium hetheringtonii TaxID=911720 RepID=A0AAD6DA90_9EURO|nr:hypothetical protein N7450_011625 [Penicillium hetheringtonii]